MKKRFLAVLLCICMVVAALLVMPMTAFAAGTDKEIMLGAEQIAGAQADNVYFGTYMQSSRTAKDPIKWRVLSNGSGKLFLLADQNLDVFQYHTKKEIVTWGKSTMRSWLNGYGASANIAGTDYSVDNFLDDAFNEKEQSAVSETNIVNAPNPEYNTLGGANTNDKVFLLSIDDAGNTKYGFTDDDKRIATNTAYLARGGKVGKADSWWLRSPGDSEHNAAFVKKTGVLYKIGYNVDVDFHCVRPAFNLDLSSVLFTSAAAGGKSSGTVGASALNPVSATTPTEWKLTLLDVDRNFDAATTAVNSNTLTVAYSGAAVGKNEYISAIIKDSSGNITRYGRLKNTTAAADASGTVNIDLSGVAIATTDTLYVFSEQYNGGANDDTKLTDYASELVEVSRTKNAYAIINDLMNITSNNTATYRLVSDTTDYTATFTAVDGYQLPASITVEVGSKTLTPGETTYKYDSTSGKLTIYAASITGDIEIKSVPTYTVTLDKQGGTGGTDSVTATYDSAMPAVTPPTRQSYTFTGYFDAKTGGTKYYNDDGTSAKAWDKTAETTLYAQWTANSSGYVINPAETVTKPDGTTVTTEKKLDGTVVITEKRPDGTTVKTETTPDGKTTTEVTLPEGKGKTEIKIPVDLGEEDGRASVKITTGTGEKTVSAGYSNKEVSLNVYSDSTIEILDEFVPLSELDIPAGVEATTIKAKSILGKKSIKILWTKSKGYKVDYYQIYRSVKRYSGYGVKPFFTTKTGTSKFYINTKSLKKGTTYYYKLRGVRVIDGKKYYTQWSTKAYRTFK